MFEVDVTNQVFEKKQRELRKHEIVSVLGVVFEDCLQTFATLYIEKVCLVTARIGGKNISTAATLPSPRASAVPPSSSTTSDAARTI